MMWQTVMSMRWRKCLDTTAPLSRIISNNYRQRIFIPSSSHQSLLFSSESSSGGGRKIRKQQSSPHAWNTVPNYLLPPAYRDRNVGGGQKNNSPVGGGGLGSHRRGGQSSPRSSGKQSNNHASYNSHRRRRSLGKQRRRQSFSKTHNAPISEGEHAALDIDSLRQLEETLTVQKTEYMSKMGVLSSLSVDVKRSETVSVNSQILAPDEKEIRATEELYEKVASDFKALVVGWSEIAESICIAKRSGKSAEVTSESDEEDNEPSVSDYEDAVLRAGRHLESYEDLYRNHMSVVSSLEEWSKKRAEAIESSNASVLGKISSLVGDFFTNPLDSSAKPQASFDDSWTRAGDGRASSTPSSAREVDSATASSSGEEIMKAPTLDLSQQVSLYEHVLLANHSSYCFGKDAKEKSTTRSNRLLNRWISFYCASSESDESKGHGGEEAGERKLFHAVIRQNGDLGTVEGVKRAEDWLKRMVTLQTSGRETCGPDMETYNLVLLGYCNLCKLFHTTPSPDAMEEKDEKNEIDERTTRQFIVDGAERLLLELADHGSNEDGGPRPNTISLNLALNAIAKAGQSFPDQTCQRTNSLIFKVFGEGKYREILEDANNASSPPLEDGMSDADSIDNSDESKGMKKTSSTPPLEPNLDTYHWLVDIYSNSRQVMHIKQGMNLLKKMIQIRSDQDPTGLASENRSRNRSRRTAPASFAPSVGTLNRALKAVVERVDDLSELSNSSDEHRDILAKEVTDILDSMVQYESSFPSPLSFLLMMTLWRKTLSPDAGEYAEEILSRMEIAGLYQDELKMFSKAYGAALECWLTSAKAGKSGAAERAFRLLKTMEVQAGRDRTIPVFTEYLQEAFEIGEVFDRSMYPQSRMYQDILKICAATHVKEDLPRAMAIAFEVYDKMIEANVDPSPKTFEFMYACVKNYLDCHPEEQRQGLLQKVFEYATKHGITRGELIGRHKESLRRGNLAA